LRQIEAISPDIVIGGRTLHLLFNDLGLKVDDFKKEGSASCCSKNGRLYIDAFHPSQWRISQENYVNDILAAIRRNLIPAAA
jgi:hypothetical protein